MRCDKHHEGNSRGFCETLRIGEAVGRVGQEHGERAFSFSSEGEWPFPLQHCHRGSWIQVRAFDLWWRTDPLEEQQLFVGGVTGRGPPTPILTFPKGDLFLMSKCHRHPPKC